VLNSTAVAAMRRGLPRTAWAARHRPLFAVALCLLSLGGCKSKVDAQTVAKVNDRPILQKQYTPALERSMARFIAQGTTLPPGIEARIKETVLRRLIDDEIIAQKAQALKIEVDAPEVDRKFSEHKERFTSDEAFKSYLQHANLSETVVKEDLRQSLLRDRVIDKLAGTVQVTDEDVQKFYADSPARFAEPVQIRARRIVIKVVPGSETPQRADRKKLAQKVHRAALRPGADFAQLARDHSEGPEASRGGDMGNFFARGHLPPDFEVPVFAMEPKKISEILETKLGYEIVEVLDKKEARQKPFAEVKDTIRASLLSRLRNEKRRDVLRDLKAAAKVEVLMSFTDSAAQEAAEQAASQPAKPLVPRAPEPAAAPPGEAVQPGTAGVEAPQPMPSDLVPPTAAPPAGASN
jgi:peptidyl-prolyl cis-trans isomerase SurA